MRVLSIPICLFNQIIDDDHEILQLLFLQQLPVKHDLEF